MEPMGIDSADSLGALHYRETPLLILTNDTERTTRDDLPISDFGASFVPKPHNNKQPQQWTLEVALPHLSMVASARGLLRRMNPSSL
jgi:hypothetical protein